MTNLLDNAIRHTPEGRVIEVQLRREGERIQVCVSDNGPGIPDAPEAGLFVRPAFQSADPDGSGGLGLVIVHRILQLHGSDVRLEKRAERSSARHPGRGLLGRDQRHLFVRNGGTRTISAFTIEPDGDLVAAPIVSGLPPTAVGLAAN